MLPYSGERLGQRLGVATKIRTTEQRDQTLDNTLFLLPEFLMIQIGWDEKQGLVVLRSPNDAWRFVGVEETTHPGNQAWEVHHGSRLWLLRK